MKIYVISFLLFFPVIAHALDPASVTITNLRGEAVSEANSGEFYRGETIHFTNCVAFSGTATNGARQDLTGLTVLLSGGDGVIAGQTVTGNITTATSGVWNAALTLRTSDGVKTYLQLRITNDATSFVYPLKYIHVKSKL